MQHTSTVRITWRDALDRQKPLLLPVAHDALAARLIERAGFTAYQIGGFAVAGAMHAVPDIDLEHFGEKSAAARNIIGASSLPAMVDADDGYGDAKNVTRTVRDYELMRAAAIFIEDQVAPKKCGHMSGKQVVPAEVMAEKIRAAIAARSSADFFILARTDAIEPEGVDKAIDRGKRYLDAGADGVYLEGPTSVDELEKIGKAFRGVPLATSVLERGGKTPWLSPAQFGEIGFRMILYPTTVLFGMTKAIEDVLNNLRAGEPLPALRSVDMSQFEQIVDMPYWADIENRFGGREH